MRASAVEAAGARWPDERGWRLMAYAYGALVALAVGYFLFRMPLQVSDNVTNIMRVQAVTLGELLASDFSGGAYLRPFLNGLNKILVDASGGRFFATFKTFHALQVLVLLLLAVRLLRVRTMVDFAAVPFAIIVLLGIHTFNGTVREEFPVNTFMTILVCSVMAVNLSFSKGGWWVDALATLLFVYAALTVESGLLVWVCLVAGYVVGLRGVSRRGLATVTALLALYFYARFGLLAIGSPGLMERSSGLGFSVRDPDELIRLFGDNPLPFYAYNVVCSVLSVLFSEPRAGVWAFARNFLQDELRPWQWINVIASGIATAFLVRFAVVRARVWWRREFTDGDRLVLIFAAVLAANAAISYPYTKDVIMSPAGVFYGLAAGAAARDAVEWVSARPRAIWVGPVMSLALIVAAGAWSVRALGLAQTLRHTAFVNRNDWATVDEWLDQPGIGSRYPEGRELVTKLRREALAMPVPNPYFTPRWADRYVDQY